MFPMPSSRFPQQSPGTAHYVYQSGQAVQQFPQQQQQQHPGYVLTYNVNQGQQHLVPTGPPPQHQPQQSGSGNLLMQMYNVVNTPPPAQGAVSISTPPKHLQPPSVVTQTVMPMHTTHVQSQVAPPPASPSPSVTLLTPGKLTGQNNSEPNVIVIKQSPDADKVSAQSKDEECMYLKIKQAGLNNPCIRQYLG